MKKQARILILLCALLTLCACAQIQQNNNVALPADDDAPGDADDQQQTQAPGGGEAAAPVYVALDNVFVGGYIDGQWESTGKIGASYETGTVFTAGPVFNQQYYYYEKGEAGQKADGVSTHVGDGPGGFEKPRTEEFAPYARECDEWGYAVFDLPCELGEEAADIPLPVYGFSLAVGPEQSDKRILAVSTERDLLVGNPQWYGDDWGETVSQKEADAVQAVLKENGISAEPWIETVRLDFDGDGRTESIVFANTPWDEDGWWEISEADGGTFALALLLREDGSVETIYSRFADYTDDMTAIYRLRPIGAYDIDGDGIAEVCMTIGYWEGAEHFVFQRRNGGWETVLNAASGT